MCVNMHWSLFKLFIRCWDCTVCLWGKKLQFVFVRWSVYTIYIYINICIWENKQKECDYRTTELASEYRHTEEKKKKKSNLFKSKCTDICVDISVNKFCGQTKFHRVHHCDSPSHCPIGASNLASSNHTHITTQHWMFTVCTV